MGVFVRPASSSPLRMAPTRPSIMSDGAMMSTPDRASETDVRASNSSVASFTISYSAVAGGAAAAAAPSDCGPDFTFTFSFTFSFIFTMPQCPCDMYSHRQTSPISTTSLISLLMARAALCTMPSSAQAPVATSSFFSGSPNKMTADTPKARVSRGHGGLDPTAGDYGCLHGLRQKRLRQPWAHPAFLESDDGGHGYVVFQPGMLGVV